jgi:hypothetical protein
MKLFSCENLAMASKTSMIFFVGGLLLQGLALLLPQHALGHVWAMIWYASIVALVLGVLGLASIVGLLIFDRKSETFNNC